MHLSSCSFTLLNFSLHPSFSCSGGHVNLGPAHFTCLWQFCACLSFQTQLSAIKVTVLEDEQDPRRQKAQQSQQALQIATKPRCALSIPETEAEGRNECSAAQSEPRSAFKCSHRGEARETLLFFCSFNQRRGLFHVS